MRRVIITTVGTSLISTWERNVNNPGEMSVGQSLFESLKTKKIKAAETDSIAKLNPDKQYDYLYLVSSDTDRGIKCADVLANYYTDEGYMYVEKRVIRNVGRSLDDFQNYGMMNLFEEFSKIVEDHANAKIIINATGGFKAMTSYATFFGITHGYEVVYLFEEYRDILEFPPLPVSIDNQYILPYMNQFNEIIAAQRKLDARLLIEQLPESLRGFFRKQGDKYDYSAIGRLFLQRLKRETNSRACTIRTNTNHTSIWGDGIQDIGRISDSDIRDIFRKIFDTVPYVTCIFLDEMFYSSTHGEPYMEYVETLNQALRYKIYTSYGAQNIKIEVLQGMEKESLRLLGKKIYA
jgi:putative CRISPR-associated protein (TIGR02619 family)